MQPSDTCFNAEAVRSCFGGAPCDWDTRHPLGQEVTAATERGEEPDARCDLWLAGQSEQAPRHVCFQVLENTVLAFARERAAFHWLPGTEIDSFLGEYPLPAGRRAIGWWLTNYVRRLHARPFLPPPMLRRPETARIGLAVRRRTERAECWFLGLVQRAAARTMAVDHMAGMRGDRADFERELAARGEIVERHTAARNMPSVWPELMQDAIDAWGELAGQDWRRIVEEQDRHRGILPDEEHGLAGYRFLKPVRLYEGEDDPDLLKQIAGLQRWYDRTLLGKVVRTGRPVHTGTFKTRAQFIETVQVALQEVRQAGLSETEERLCEFLAYQLETRGGLVDARQLRKWMAQFSIDGYRALVEAAKMP